MYVSSASEEIPVYNLANRCSLGSINYLKIYSKNELLKYRIQTDKRFFLKRCLSGQFVFCPNK